MNILITGGAGFIGSNLVRAALRSGHSVTVIDNLSTGSWENVAGLDIRFINGDILDPTALNKSLNDVDAIVHLAALGSVPRSIADPITTHQVNATGTLHVLEAARSAAVPHVITASSSSVYGMNPARPKSERHWVRPMSPYAVSKLSAEQYTLAYQQSYGMTTAAFRFFNVYGPRQMPGHAYAAVIPVFLDALLSGRALPVNGDGKNSRDFTYVDTVCQVLLAAVTARACPPEPINLAYGTNTTLLELIDKLAAVSGLPVDVEFRSPRRGDVAHSQADNSALTRLFPKVQPVTLDEGLLRTLEWFKEER